MPFDPHGPPLAHTSPAPHAAPLAILGTHWLALQYLPLAQLASLEHAERHADAPHA